MIHESRIFQDIANLLKEYLLAERLQEFLEMKSVWIYTPALCQLFSTDGALMNCFPEVVCNLQVNKYEGTLFSPLLF